jgi:glycine cleavage system regulatory protein
MQSPLVMTVLGMDRTGLVESIARLVAEHGGNWQESRMCRLGGEFAGILRVQVPVAQRQALEQALAKLTELQIIVRSAEAPSIHTERRFAALDVVGPDRPGIVREISHALAAQGVNVEELSTECISAPMSGEPLFSANAKLGLPPNVALSDLRASLERAVTGMNVEVSLAEAK